MKTEELIGLFVRGSLKNSSKFYGVCVEVDDTYLTLTGAPNSEKKKLVKLSEIVELDASPVRVAQNE